MIGADDDALAPPLFLPSGDGSFPGGASGACISDSCPAPIDPPPAPWQRVAITHLGTIASAFDGGSSFRVGAKLVFLLRDAFDFWLGRRVHERSRAAV